MSDTLRLFFAIPCPGPLAAELAQWRDAQGLPGRPVPTENLHLTLAFLGAQPIERLETLYQVAEGVKQAAFEIVLDRLHCTRRGLLWIEPGNAPSALMDLADELRERLTAVAIPFDGEAFRPHITLFREDAELPSAAPPSFRWQADRFGLYRSENGPGGVKYRPLQEWPLQRPGG